VRHFLNTLAVGCVALAGLTALNGPWVTALLLIGAASCGRWRRDVDATSPGR
jgi:hypothetical protein